MKHLSAYLLMVLILLPLGHPCSAMLEAEEPVAACCAGHQKADEAAHHCHHDQDNSNHHTSDDENDGCNPSCTCSCCGIISMLVTPFSFPSGLVSFEWAAHFPACSQYTYDFTSSIWQPPRLS